MEQSMQYLEEVHINVVSSISGAVLAMALSAAPAYASEVIACGTRVDSFLNASRTDGRRVLGIGSTVTARGSLGFTHFAMAQGYQIEVTPLHTSGAPPSATFALGYNATSDAFTGDFTEVFTDRGNGDEDRTSLWVSRGGDFWLRSITWNGSWLKLQNVVCYADPQVRRRLARNEHGPLDTASKVTGQSSRLGWRTARRG